jgi:hypothetical protein
MSTFKKSALSIAILTLTLTACGGGGGGSSTPTVSTPPPADPPPVTETPEDENTGGISGSGQRTLGVIDGFGSIFVNGVRYDTSTAAIFRDGQRVTEDALAVGMVVFIEGTINEDGVTGIATTVIIDNELEGPITAIETAPNGDSKLITVLGINVILERTGTTYDNTTFETLAIDDVVEISGFPGVSETLRATRVEKEGRFIPGQTQVEIEGVIRELTASTFKLGIYTVDWSGATLEDFEGNNPVDGDIVDVKGTLVDNTITARIVDKEDDDRDRLSIDDNASIQGTIGNFISASDFSVNGIQIDASNARLEPSNLTLANGIVVEVEGNWDGTLLTASEVEGRRGTVEIEARVSSVDIDASTITLSLAAGGGLVVTTNNRTQFDDDTGQNRRFGLADIRSGDYLEIEAYALGDALIATKVDREDDADDDSLQGPVEAFTPGVDITVLGITYTVNGTDFDDFNGRSLSSEAFFAALSIGDIVSIDDDSPADGNADEIEFEDGSGRPDGGLEFDDDDDDDDGDDDRDDDNDGDNDASDDDDDREREFEGKVTAVEAGVSIAINNISFTVDGNTLYFIDDIGSVSASVFFDAVSVGRVVEVTDYFPTDGVADELELEDLDDDSSDDDSSDDDSSDDDSSDDDDSDD